MLATVDVFELFVKSPILTYPTCIWHLRWVLLISSASITRVPGSEIQRDIGHSRQFLATPTVFGALLTPVEFHQDLWHQKTKSPSIVQCCLHDPTLSRFGKHQFVTDRWVDKQSQITAYTTLALFVSLPRDAILAQYMLCPSVCPYKYCSYKVTSPDVAGILHKTFSTQLT